MRVLLEHIHRSINRSAALAPDRFVGFELGNELFAPKHITPHTAAGDIVTAAALLKSVWGLPFHSRDTTLPRLYATGTNDCQRRNNSDTMAALLPAKLGMRSGFSWHSYPGPSSTTIVGEIAELPPGLEWAHSAG